MKRPYFYFFLTVLIVLSLLSCTEGNKSKFSEVSKISIRDVGNSLLLTNQDSTSLILPVKQISPSKFELSFEQSLSFNPEDLVKFTKSSFETANLSENYRVEVLRCHDLEVAYSYQMNLDAQATIIPCGNRRLPSGCYLITYDFLDMPPAADNHYWYYLALIGTILLLISLWIFLKSKTGNNAEVGEGYYLGSYTFYPEQNKLVKSAMEISLSKKECEILEILVAQKNQVIKRDELSKKVWEDNGVIVGRSLDTYISKLRKKLKDDQSIKLTNVHGVGYKLEID